MHLWPLLALIEKGVGPDRSVEFTESDEFAFWSRYARFPDEQRAPKDAKGNFTKNYYIEALIPEGKPSDYPHRGPWTIRTRTFLNAWKAAEFYPSTNLWRLSKNYAAIFAEKVLRKGDRFYRVPVLDLAVWLLRGTEFPDGADWQTLLATFRKSFAFEEGDYDRLFELEMESSPSLYTDSNPSPQAYRKAIEDVLVDPQGKIAPPEPLFGTRPETKSVLEDDDAILVEVQRLLQFGSSGTILRGCPGTSKTWYAKQIAYKLADTEHVFQVQFHPSYGYEDFIEGYLPDESTKSGFKIIDKIFMEACRAASKVKTPVIFIIDEINRGDPARVFGELLTYIEHGYRGVEFSMTYSGKRASIPPNLVLLGTMNQYDRSITQLDLALIRRFDHIDLKPSAEIAASFLSSSELTSEQVDSVIRWFEKLQTILPPSSGGIGHTYFRGVTRPDELSMIWNYRMLPYCESITEFEPQRLDNAKKSFDAMYRSLLGQTGATPA